MEQDIKAIHEAIKEDQTILYDLYKGYYKEFTENLNQSHEDAKMMACTMLTFYYTGEPELSEDEIIERGIEVESIIDYAEEHIN